MNRLIILVLLIFNQNIYSQKTSNILLGINHPIKYSDESTFRKTGVEFGFGFLRQYKNQFYFETNLSASFWTRINYSYPKIDYIEIENPPQVYPVITYDKSSRFSFDANLSFLVGDNLSSKFSLKNGLVLVARNIYSYDSKYSFNIKPEDFSNFNSYYYDYYLVTGIDYCIGLSYEINDKYSSYFNFRTNIIEFNNRKLNNHSYGMASLGLILKIASR